MFNWIQTYLTKHFKWLIVILLAVVVVSFVFTIGNFSPLGGGGPSYKEQPFLGYDLSSERDQREIFGAGQISLTMNYPSFFGQPSPAQVQDYALARVAFINVADEIGLPDPNKEEIKAHIQELAGFMNFQTQGFDQTRFTAFVDSLKASGLSESYVTRIVKNDWRMNKVRELLQGPGHMLPFEAINAAEAANTEWTLETAKMDYAAFTVDINPTEEELKTYFENNSFRYIVDAKTKASYINFDPKNYIDDSYEPEAGEKSIHFFTNKARYQATIPTPEPITKDDGTTETPETPEVTLEDVEEQIIAELRLEKAKSAAQQVAEEFAYTLFDQGIANGSDDFNTLLAKTDVSLKPLVSYPQSAVIMQDGLTNQTLNQVFRLNDNRYFSDPIQNYDQYVILIYQGEEASFTPEYSDVQVKVTADFVEEKKRAAFIVRGEEIKKALVTSMGEGSSFEEAAKAQELAHASYDTFKRNESSPEGLSQDLLAQLDNLSEGDISDWITNSTSGTFVYAKTKSVPSFDESSEEVKAYLDSQRGRVSNVDSFVRDILTEALAQTSLAPENT